MNSEIGNPDREKSRKRADHISDDLS